jgi:hypothetical protein
MAKKSQSKHCLRTALLILTGLLLPSITIAHGIDESGPFPVATDHKLACKCTCSSSGGGSGSNTLDVPTSGKCADLNDQGCTFELVEGNTKTTVSGTLRGCTSTTVPNP